MSGVAVADSAADPRANAGPVRFRQLLERLGPTFVKLGQFLAMRPDVLPQEDRVELFGLFDRVPPFPWAEARAIVEAELGAPPERLFAAIETVPFASASLAQVHAARLEDGTEVAVKIQRPDLRRQVIRDLRKARLLARLWQVAGPPIAIPPGEIVGELSGWMMQEIDFSRELVNITRMHRLMEGSRFERIPRPFPRFSTSRVLTTERLHGVPLSDALNAIRTGDEAMRRRLDELGIDPDRFAVNLIQSVLHQILRLEFFHADVHPGNLVMLRGNVVGFVDFGLCDELDEVVRQQQFRYLRALYTHDLSQMHRALADILVPGVETDAEQFKTDFFAQSHTWLAAMRPRERTRSSQSPIARGLVEAVRLARRHHLKFPARILSMYRTLLGAESVASQLSATANLRRVGRTFFRRVRRDELRRAFEPGALENYLLSSATLLRDAPRQLHQILSDLADDRTAIRVITSESGRLRRVANRRARLIATAIVSVSVAVLLATSLPTVLGIPLRWLLATVLALLYLSMFLQWRRLR